MAELTPMKASQDKARERDDVTQKLHFKEDIILE